MDFNLLDELTEYTKGYKRISPSFEACCNALPSSVIKLARGISSLILRDKTYKKDDDGEESKRIYNNIYANFEDIMKEVDPASYKYDEDAISSNISNWRNRAKDLQDNNVFHYIMLGKRPQVCLFGMDRFIPSWKFFNSKGCVVPKFVRKIVNSAEPMAETLYGFACKSGKQFSIEQSRLEIVYFIGRIIHKMNSSVAKELPTWCKNYNFESYMSDLRRELEGMNDYEGLIVDSSFLRLVPPSVERRYESLLKKKMDGEDLLNVEECVEECEGNECVEIIAETNSLDKVAGEAEVVEAEKMKSDNLESELEPCSPNLGKKRRNKAVDRSSSEKLKKTTKTTKTTTTEGIKPKLEEFASLDPFKDAPSLVEYYHYVLRGHDRKASLLSVEQEVIAAGRILDKLDQYGKTNRLFLKKWIQFFIAHNLGGKKIFHNKYTSLSEMFKTFEDYNKIFFTPQ